MPVRRFSGGVLPLVISGLMSACGGGGSGGGETPPVNANPPPNTPDLSFTDVTGASGIAFTHGYQQPLGTDPEQFSGGAAAGDYDGDGDVDLFIVRGDIGPNRLYRNDGNLIFTDMAQAAGLAYTGPNQENHRLSGPTFADMDGDGDLDLFIGGIYGSPSFIYANQGDGTFVDVTENSGIDNMDVDYTVSAAFGDYDKDGDLDMALAHWGQEYSSHLDPGDTRHLWRNDSDTGGIRFTSVSVEANISATAISPRVANGVLDGIFDYSFAPTFADINGDGYPDLLMANDFGTTRLFENNGDGTFADITDNSDLRVYSAMGSAVADYDNDGDLDWFMTAIYDEGAKNPDHGNRLYRNDGTGRFADITEQAGVLDGGWGWAACFADFDNDGHLDIYHVNGWNNLATGTEFEKDPSRLYIANGDGTFTDRAASSGIVDYEQGRAVVCADFDNDGDSDVFAIHRNPGNAAFLYRNDSSGNNWLGVKLRGAGKNVEAAGARVVVTVNGQAQTREITIGTNFTSQNPTLQLFGVGAASQVDRIEVTWPDGGVETHENLAVGQVFIYQR